MLSNPKSNKLSLYLTNTIFVILVFFTVAMPKITSVYIKYIGRPDKLFPIILITFYLCAPLGYLALFSLRRLLKNIIANNIFVENNIKQLNILFYCCLAVSVITLISGFFYLPFLIVGIAAGFFALILRVIKNVFRSAIEIKSENELTI